jgi:hypothetical protein
MLRVLDSPLGQALSDALYPEDQPLLHALCKYYEGKTPTARQKSPHSPDTLAFATWVITRLGALTCYYTKLGPATHCHIASGVITRTNACANISCNCVNRIGEKRGDYPSNEH